MAKCDNIARHTSMAHPETEGTGSPPDGRGTGRCGG
eukprot:CAMPEP_0174379164 /NCGR_PEP_ID=MMETSP0811_2-20130205/122530_1 /TAXON_ID=73025 ORGANISM="Eutreptiella gymnastica-like, Strain CCMP1594" /NCGR_SAMPLE_ID=MMETSP0811_2 /ASSEMBLY_ACC=CAM_ASM_000667 /LENGTH=35 /DNA_ID= /DNA_START= /DNA_END= /DNA_ORIENTATION=